MTTDHPERSSVVLFALASLAAGAGAAVQAKANGALATRLGAPVEAALWSFGSGWLVLALGLALMPAARRALADVARAVRRQHLQWWEVLGGLFGGFFVAVQSFAVPQMGVALFTIAMVGGQTANALLVDKIGVGSAGPTPLSMPRVLAALATFVGVAVASSARGGTVHALILTALLMTVAAGAGMSIQQAINGKVNMASGHVVATTFVNFTWGFAALCGYALALFSAGRLHSPRTLDVPWWSLVGGVIGVVYIAIAAAAVRHLGVLVTALMSLTGQLVAAVLLDVVTHAAPVTAQLLAGVAITLTAAAAAGLAAQRGTRG